MNPQCNKPEAAGVLARRYHPIEFPASVPPAFSFPIVTEFPAPGCCRYCEERYFPFGNKCAGANLGKRSARLTAIVRCVMHIFPVAVTFVLAAGVSFAQNPASPAQSGTTRESQSASTQPGQSTASGVSDIGKSQKYKGTLVDATCAGQSADRATAANASTAETRTGKDASKNQKASNAADSCPATANTNDFALRLRDGRALRFDSVGNERAKEELKTKKKWADAASNGKPIRGTVHGVESGDRIMALSVD